MGIRLLPWQRGKTKWNQTPSTPSWAWGGGGHGSGAEMKYVLLWVRGESLGLRLNDLHPHPLSILNFKFVIRKDFG